ncbi:TetR/AcrR family transcriptional regulator [Nitrincola sp. MINF-07-Sa-05]|uniref:TetR/AcrR family transcriptional regulator n=1 Tax=Nitrincola salilacus TaxID=3400273 RepID=UPI003917DCAC
MSRIREKNQDLILTAASEVFAEKGYAGAKTSDIADKAGLPKANVYYYFQSKKNLYQSVLESIIEPLMEAYIPFEEDDDHPAPVLRAYIRSKLEISRTLPHASKVFASEIMHGAPHLSPEMAEELHNKARYIIARLQSWIDRGLISPDIDPQHLLFSIWASTQTYADFGWQISTVSGKQEMSDEDYEAAAATLTQLVLRGCGITQ